MNPILGFDIGGTKTAVVVGTRDGEILRRQSFATDAHRGFEAIFADMAAAGREILGGERPAAIGASIGGPLDTQRGIIYSPPNLPGWDAVPLKARLEDSFGVDTYVEHDAKACALAEWMFGAARGKAHVAFLTFGTGLGAGLILDARLYRGATDSAGEVGHWRIADDGPLIYGKRGSWEGYSSGAGIAALTHYLAPGHFPPDVTAADVIDRARHGDPEARRVVDSSAEHLGRGIALLVDLLNLEMVVLGSLAVRAGDLFLSIVREVVTREALPGTAAACQVVPAALGGKIGDVAALCAALYRMQ